MRKLLLLFITIISFAKAHAQDPHFTQFFASPLTLNSAFTGKFDGTIRVAGNYRNQWPTINRAYNTKALSIDFPILQGSIAEIDRLGVGIQGYSDQSADGAVKFNYASGSAAFHKGLSENGYDQLGAAFQVTYANMQINSSKLKFEDQLTSLGFTGVTSEIFNNSTLSRKYIDVNAGVLYTGSKTDQDNYYAGISLYHINKPKQSFTGGFYELAPRATIHAGGYFPSGTTGTIHLSAMYSSQAKASETVFGGAYQFRLTEEENPTSFYAGAWYRVKDAIAPYVGLEFGTLRLGMTYDVNMSDLKTASNSRGGFEISLIYINRPADTKGVPCPKF